MSTEFEYNPYSTNQFVLNVFLFNFASFNEEDKGQFTISKGCVFNFDDLWYTVEASVQTCVLSLNFNENDTDETLLR